MKKSPLSLKMRAIGLLSQREHSPLELRRKLLRILREQRRAAEMAATAHRGDVSINMVDDRFGTPGGAELDAEAEVETLLGWLQAQGYLSETRFVESRIHARAQRYGSQRIQQELSQHGLSLGADERAALQASELERARAVWQRKFGGRAPQDASERARQTRFLLTRGFAGETVRRVLNSAVED